MINEVEGHDRQGCMLVPPPPTTGATGAVYDPRVGGAAATSAALTVPIATATILGNVPVCEVMQARYNDEERVVGDRGGGANDALPVCSIKCGKFVKIGLAVMWWWRQLRSSRWWS